MNSDTTHELAKAVEALTKLAHHARERSKIPPTHDASSELAAVATYLTTARESLEKWGDGLVLEEWELFVLREPRGVMNEPDVPNGKDSVSPSLWIPIESPAVHAIEAQKAIVEMLGEWGEWRYAKGGDDVMGRAGGAQRGRWSEAERYYNHARAHLIAVGMEGEK